MKNAENALNFFGFAEAVFVGIQRRSGLGHFQKCLGIRTGGIIACGSAQVGFGGAIVSQMESSLAGTIKSGKRIGVELDGLAELRERALVVADFGIKIGDAGMENGIFGKIPGKNDELRFGLTGVSPLEIEVDQFEKGFAAVIICIFRPDAEDGTVEVAFSVGNLPGAGGEACQMKINDAILWIDLPKTLVVVDGLLGVAGLREGFGEAEAIIPIPWSIEQSGAKGFDGGNGAIFLEFGVATGVPLLAEQVAAAVVGLGVGMSDGGEKYGDEN